MSTCSEFMIGDWVQDNHQFPMQARVVGEDYLYANFEGNEADPWEFDDKTELPYPIPITDEILKKNNIEWEFYDCYHFKFEHKGIVVTLSGYPYIHELQQALRLAGLKEMADNFKI